jgi:HemY protein
MKFILLLFAALATGIALTQLVDDPGYVLITRQPWAFESSLGVFLLGLIILFGALYFLIRTLTNLLGTPARLERWSQQRHTRQALDSQHKGLEALIVGDWQQAQKALLKYIDTTTHPDINYLAAAWAAQQQGDIEQRDVWLARASDTTTAKDIAVGILQCRLQMQAEQNELALATATSLQQTASSNQVIMRLLVKLLEQAADWQLLVPLLSSAEKIAALPEEELSVTTLRVIDRMLSASKTTEELDQHIQLIPKKLRRDEHVIASMARAMNRLEQYGQSEKLLRTAINNQWSDELAGLYGETRTSDPAAQLKHAEAWASDHPLSTVLMLTLGRLAMRSQLWGMARSYLDVAVHNGDSAEAFLEMGWLLETINESERAREMFRRGLELMTGHSRDESIPDQITRISTSSEDQLDDSITHAPSLVYSNESK